MASDDPAHRRNQSTNSIPLQDLNGNGTQEHGLGIIRSESHRRTLSDRGRALFVRGRDRPENRRYAPINERSPSPPQRSPRGTPLSPIAIVTTPDGDSSRIPDPDDEAGLSPVDDRGAFQAAIGFAGLSFNAGFSSPDEDDDDVVEETPPRPSRSSRPTLPSIRTIKDSDDMVAVELNDGPDFFSPITGHADEDDTMPLTDAPRMRPSTLAAPVIPDGQRHDRQRSRTNSNLSVRFSPGRGRSSSYLGDDLPQVEAGSRTSGSNYGASNSSRNRSLSPSAAESPFQRTGTMLRLSLIHI